MIKFDDYKNCLLNGEVILKSQQRFISKGHDVYTENINKIAFSSNGDKRIVSSDKITSYQYGYKGKNALINNIISEIPKTKDRLEYLDQIILEGSVGIPRSNNTQGIGGSN